MNVEDSRILQDREIRYMSSIVHDMMCVRLLKHDNIDQAR